MDLDDEIMERQAPDTKNSGRLLTGPQTLLAKGAPEGFEIAGIVLLYCNDSYS